ncbi:hypothetical protein ABZ894_30885 [Nocardia beijingensis]|uniref:hypothetical protein n=1 Tax=Nocardia beijingensis TaxID=95162 RepID=UPI0033F176F7
MWQGVRSTGSVAIDGFRFTPGWGSLGSITVGLLAVLVASYWNYRTLNRVEERYQDDLREAHADKVRDSILDVVHQTTQWAWAFKQYRDLTIREFATVGSQDEATAAEKRIRAEIDKVATANYNLRRALWAAQLIVDDIFVRESLAETVELLGIRQPEAKIEWEELPAKLEELHENRVKVNEKVDAVLDYALENMQKRAPIPTRRRRSLWRQVVDGRTQ